MLMKRNALQMIAASLLIVALFAPFMPQISLSAQGDPTVNCLPNQPTPDCDTRAVYGSEMRALAAEISANPTVTLPTLPVAEQELYRRAFRKVLEPTTIHDAPGGNVIGDFPQGFIFVPAGVRSNGWVQIAAGQWVEESKLGPAGKSVSRFSGVLLPNGMPTTPFAWMLLDTKPSRTPGAKPLKETETVKRYTLVNIYAIAVVDSWEWYLIGQDQWVLQTRVAKVKPTTRPADIPAGRKWVSIDLYEQTLTAYEGDRPVFATLIASGLEQWGTTEGTFQVFQRLEATRMRGAIGQPEYWNLPGVPYTMFFNKDEQAIHGAYWHDLFGYRRSRGCINLSITDAKWVFEWSADQPDYYVNIFHSAKYRSGAPQQ